MRPCLCLVLLQARVCAALPMPVFTLWLLVCGEADTTLFPSAMSLPSVLLWMLLVEPKLPRSLPMMTIR